jgi:glycosyltransferase involved in cell wall biosynthesis
MYEVYEQVGCRFATAASKYISDSHDLFLGFTSASLEALKAANRIGIRTVLDQIDAAGIAFDLATEEEGRFPKLSHGSLPRPSRYFARVSEEWQQASQVIVNSQWSKRALMREGVPEAKIAVVPLAFDPGRGGRVRLAWTGELKVLWLGALSLQKGLGYAIQAAEKLLGLPVSFTFAGPCDVRKSGLVLPSNCQYIGAVPRPEARRLYDEHDVFIFPTLSDGFGLTQVEALGFGLPVIATPCCGEVVEHEKSGLLIPPRDAKSLAEGIQRLIEDPDLLPRMSAAAIVRSKDFQADKLWSTYAEALWPGHQSRASEPARPV